MEEGEMRKPAWERALDKCREEGPLLNGTPCWVFGGSKTREGYGMIGVAKSRAKIAHRVTYEYFIHEIPPGLVLDHLCRNRSCLNPWHLEPVTQAVNCQRGEVGNHLASRTHCNHGHEFTPENTGTRPTGYRFCRACKSIYDKKIWAARKEARA